MVQKARVAESPKSKWRNTKKSFPQHQRLKIRGILETCLRLEMTGRAHYESRCLFLEKNYIAGIQVARVAPVAPNINSYKLYHCLRSEGHQRPAWDLEMTGRSQLETLAFCGGNLVLALLLFALVCMTRRQIPQVVSGGGGFKVSKLKSSGDGGFKVEN